MDSTLIWSNSLVIEFITKNWIIKESSILFAIKTFKNEQEVINFPVSYDNSKTNSTEGY